MLMEVLSMLLIPPRLRLVVDWVPWAFCLLMLMGCNGHGIMDSARDAASGAASAGGGAAANADPFLRDLRSVLIPVSWGAIALGIVGFALSYFLPLIPRQSAAVAIGCGIGCLVLLGLVAKFSGFIAWSLLIAGIICGLATGIPFLFGAFRWAQRRAGVDLEPGPGPGADAVDSGVRGNRGGGVLATKEVSGGGAS